MPIHLNRAGIPTALVSGGAARPVQLCELEDLATKVCLLLNAVAAPHTSGGAAKAAE
jgi:hypothetical protein